MYVPEAQDSEWLLGVGRLAMWSRELHHKKGDFEMPCIEQWRGGRNNDRTVKLINNMIGLLFNKLLIVCNSSTRKITYILQMSIIRNFRQLTKKQ